MPVDTLDKTDIRGFVLKLRMVRESETILQSIDFLEQEIQQKLLEFDVAVDQHKDKEVETLKDHLAQLLFKIHREEAQMDSYMVKYKEMCQNEKKELLSSLSKTKQVPLRGVPPNTHGPTQGKGLPEKTQG